MHLDKTKIFKWRDLVNTFIKQYKFNIDVVPGHSNLET
jgi:hypothetical protein